MADLSEQFNCLVDPKALECGIRYLVLAANKDHHEPEQIGKRELLFAQSVINAEINRRVDEEMEALQNSA